MRARRGPFTVGLALSLAIMALRPSAHAQSSAGRATACSRLDADITLSVRERVAGHTAAALAVLEDLHRRCPVPQVTAQLALAEIDAGHLQGAWQHLAAALADATDPWARSRRAALIVARTELRARMGAIRVQGDPPGAEVLVDGQPIGVLPLGDSYVLAPGTYRVELRSPGRATAADEVSIRAGQDLEVVLASARVEPSPVSVRAIVTPPPLSPDGATPVRPARIVGYGLLGFGVAAAATSAVMIFQSSSQADALRGATASSPGAEGAFVRFVTRPGYTPTDRSTATACLVAAVDSTPDGRVAATLCADSDRTRTLAWAFGVAGAVAAGVGVALVVLRPSAAAHAGRLRVSPLFLGASGVMIDGVF